MSEPKDDRVVPIMISHFQLPTSDSYHFRVATYSVTGRKTEWYLYLDVWCSDSSVSYVHNAYRFVSRMAIKVNHELGFCIIIPKTLYSDSSNSLKVIQFIIFISLSCTANRPSRSPRSRSSKQHSCMVRSKG